MYSFILLISTISLLLLITSDSFSALLFAYLGFRAIVISFIFSSEVLIMPSLCINLVIEVLYLSFASFLICSMLTSEFSLDT